MNKVLLMFLSCAIALSVRAQNASQVPGEEPYGKVSMDELQMQSCDFEKDANAEVLFDVGKFYYNDDLKSTIREVHVRIKVFNDNGRDAGNVKIRYFSGHKLENITGIDAATINLVDGKAEVTKLDKKLIFDKVIDDNYSEITFAMTNVKAGSVIEYRYKLNARYNAEIDPWTFQWNIPVRYSEFNTAIPDLAYFRVQPHFTQPLYKHTASVKAQTLKVMSHNLVIGGSSTQSDQESETFNYNNNNEIWAMANVPSLHTDEYTSSFRDNAQSVDLDLVRWKPIGGFNESFSDTWGKVAYDLSKDADFGDQLNHSLSGEDVIIGKAAPLKTDEEKIALIFNEVKTAMKWNGNDSWRVQSGPSKAWNEKTGNSTDINIILYHLLKKSGVNAYPMVVSTRNHGRVDQYYTSLIQFNRGVVYVPIDTANYYILDATGKYNLYNTIPADLLNSMGLYVSKSENTFKTVFLKSNAPARQVILINAEIKPDGKVEGTVQINCTGNSKVAAAELYKKSGEEKYIEQLKGNDNSVKITSLKMENMEVDSLPLTQNMAFSLELPGSDANYIYLRADKFTPLSQNPFLAEKRLSDIDFAYFKNYSINGVYKIPAGYKVDALPQNVSMVMPDKSISFKRIVAEQEGSIVIHYVVNYQKALFTVDEYAGLHDFYKKMFEILSEQIVLKKG